MRIGLWLRVHACAALLLMVAGAADATILVLPCGRSAHLELGYAAGLGQITGVLMNGPDEPELMYKARSFIADSIDEVIRELEARKRMEVGA